MKVGPLTTTKQSKIINLKKLEKMPFTYRVIFLSLFLKYLQPLLVFFFLFCSEYIINLDSNIDNCATLLQDKK